jgi:Ca2+-binding RTX toxin-like protein
LGTRAVREFQVQASRRFSTAIGLLIAACVIALAVTSLARAGTAQLEDPDPGGPHLTFTATSGETNHLYLLFAPGGYRVIDLGAAITAGSGCSSVSSSEVFCAFVAFDESPTIDVLLGDQGDFASVAGKYADEITVDGESGADELELGAGCELVFDGPCGNILLGGPGDDTLRVEGPFRMDGGLGGDSMEGGIVDYSTRVNPVTVDGDGVADDGEAGEGDNVASYVVLGGSAGDTFTGGVNALGGGGNDTFTAGGDGHFFAGQTGDDVCLGSAVGDLCEGGPGEDELTGGGGSDDLLGGGGADTIHGGPGRDGIYGDYGNDLLFGDEGRDFIGGGPGNDQIRARDGTRDRIGGGRGFDRARVDRGLDLARSIEAFF